MKRFSAQFSDKEFAALKELSARLERSANEVLREALRLYAASQPEE